MLTKLREPFGKAGLIVAIVALIAALGGGAYAASGGLTGKQKNEVTAIAKKYAGKNGTNGTNGSPGGKGDTGAAGSNGTNGTNGSPGGPGSNGKSVEASEIAKNVTACGGRGGAEYEVEGSGQATEICNGKEGEPWAVGGLPHGATETGTWSFSASAATASVGPIFGTDNILVPISFSVPLAAPITESSKIHFVEELGDGVNCPGSVKEPKALPGQLCIYWYEYENAEFKDVVSPEVVHAGQASIAGAFIQFKEVQDHASGAGSWAVTGG